MDGLHLTERTVGAKAPSSIGNSVAMTTSRIEHASVLLVRARVVGRIVENVDLTEESSYFTGAPNAYSDAAHVGG